MSKRLTDYQIDRLARAFTRDAVDEDEIERMSPNMLAALAELRSARSQLARIFPTFTAACAWVLTGSDADLAELRRAVRAAVDEAGREEG